MINLLKKYYLLLMILFHIASFSQPPLCISLGAACSSAFCLRGLNLRMEAFPFDWIMSPFESLCACLEDDFEHFLTNLHPNQYNNGVIDSYGFLFIHDFPNHVNHSFDVLNEEFVGTATLVNTWQSSLALVKEKYMRRINRFRNACKGKEKVFFFRSEDTLPDHAIYLRDLIIKKYPTLDFLLIVPSTTSEIWNFEKIKNFHYDEWDDFWSWVPHLKAIDAIFNSAINIRNKKDLEIFRLLLTTYIESK